MLVMAGQLFVAVSRGAVSVGRSMSVGQSICQWAALCYHVRLYIPLWLYIAVAIVQFGGDWM